MPSTSSLASLHDALVTNIGLDRSTLANASNSTLADLGVDSIGVIELEKVILDSHGITLPDELQAMTIDQIADYLAVTGPD